MPKKKLIRFKQLAGYENVIQPSFEEVMNDCFSLKGKWNELFFKNNNPIVLELGCGKGEYSVSLGKRYPEKNFVGVDIKGARIWYGATEALEANMGNVGFLRTRIDFIASCFAKGEVDDIWITFPDPQPEGRRERKRLTHRLFIDRYRKFLKPTGYVHLKTDSQFLYEYTMNEIEQQGYQLIWNSPNVYRDLEELSPEDRETLQIKTHYEGIFSEKGHKITYIKFGIHGAE